MHTGSSTHRGTRNSLFSNASICEYGRPERGGEPDSGDPYDLRIAPGFFEGRVAADTGCFRETIEAHDVALTREASTASQDRTVTKPSDSAQSRNKRMIIMRKLITIPMIMVIVSSSERY